MQLHDKYIYLCMSESNIHNKIITCKKCNTNETTHKNIICKTCVIAMCEYFESKKKIICTKCKKNKNIDTLTNLCIRCDSLKIYDFNIGNIDANTNTNIGDFFYHDFC